MNATEEDIVDALADRKKAKLIEICQAQQLKVPWPLFSLFTNRIVENR